METKEEIKYKSALMLVSCLLLLFVLSSSTAFSQSRKKLQSSNLILEGRVYYGWTMAHHVELEIFQRHYPAFEISIFKATYGRTRWEYMYNYPFIGVAYWYTDFGKVDALGSAHAIFPYINFPLYKKKASSLSLRLGLGLGYLTKRFDRKNNYKNLAIGSHLNGAFNLLLEWRWRLGKRFMLGAGIGFVHFSNGTIKTPNYGLNMPNVSLALAYRLSKENPYRRKKLLPELKPFEFDGKRSFRIDVEAAFAVKNMESQLGQGNMYMVYMLSTNVMKQIGYKSRIGLGLDATYDLSDYVVLENQGYEDVTAGQVLKTGISAAYELSFSRMAMFFNLGLYLSGLERKDGNVFEKLGLRYDITDNLYANLTLRANYGRADFVAFGIGYKFNVFYY